MYSIQSYCRRLPTETLEMVLRNHENGTEVQIDSVVEVVREILEERKAAEKSKSD